MEILAFKRVLRGYDPESVDLELTNLTAQINSLTAANKELRLQNDAQTTIMEKKLKSHEVVERNLLDAFVNAQKTATSMIDEAREYSENLKQSTRVECDRLVAESNTIVNQIVAEASNNAENLMQSARTESQSLLAETMITVESLEKSLTDSLSELSEKVKATKSELDALTERKEGLQNTLNRVSGYLRSAEELLTTH